MKIETSRKTLALCVFIALLIPMVAMAQTRSADGRGDRTLRMPPPVGPDSVSLGNGINYHNGPVMKNGTNVYYIWYGDWTQDPTANAILTDLANTVGGSPYFNINTTYGDRTGDVQNSVHYISSTADTGSLGTSLSDGNIWTLVQNALNSGALPVDSNGVYFVLTAPFVDETSGFLTSYCGWHTFGNYGVGNTPIKYSFVGNPRADMGACSIQSTGPNGDAEADAMASVITHELEEATTDPQLNAWFDSQGEENADKCAWTFGTTYTTSNGALANMRLGARDFLIQRNWVNANGGLCAQSWVSVPDFSLSVLPTSQSTAPGGTTAAYVVTATGSNGWSGTVTYSVTAGLPSGATAHITGNSITISTSSSTPSGNFKFTISGTDGTKTHTVQATLVVSQPTFSLSITPTANTVTRPPTGSGQATYTVTVTAPASYTKTVTLTVSGGASALTLTLSPTTIPNGNGTSTLTATVTAAAPATTRTITVTGKDGTTTKQATATLQIK